MKNFIKNYINESIETKQKILNDESFLEKIETTTDIIVNAYKNGNKVLLAGNGGSAADAQHLAGELVSKFLMEREGLSAIALTNNTSILTSIGNDYNHELIFARQVQAHGRNGDVFIAISTSGNSKNIINAINEAKLKNLVIIGLTGENPSSIDEICDITFKIPSTKTPTIQESHITIGHLICAMVEKKMFE